MNDDELPSTFGATARPAPSATAETAIEGWRHVEADVRAIAGRVVRDVAVARASGRWRPGEDDPPHYVPGDAVALRAFTIASDFEYLHQFRAIFDDPAADLAVRFEAAWRAQTILADTRAVYDAVPHFLDADVAAGILASRPPGPDVLGELRLPHDRVAVFLGRTLPVRECDWPEAWDHTRDLTGRPTRQRTILGELRARGGGIEGVVLTESAGRGLADEVLWLLSAEPDPERPDDLNRDRLRSVVWGLRSRSRLAPVAENLAAAVAWGEWHQARPVDLPDNHRSRDFRKALRRGEFRRREPQGAVGGVRVLDLGRSPVPDRNPTPAGTPGGRSSPISHLRRAHWRLQPVGPKSADRRLTRVAATVVRPGATPARTAVYRVLAPEDPDVDAGPPLRRDLDLRRVDLPIRPQPAPSPEPPAQSGAEVLP